MTTNRKRHLKSEFVQLQTSLILFNRPFPISKKFHFPNEAKCETFVVEMSFNYDANKTHFHNKGFALSLVLKVKLFGTRKWPISFNLTNVGEFFSG